MSIHVSDDMSIDVSDDMSIDVIHDMSIDMIHDMSIDVCHPFRRCFFLYKSIAPATIYSSLSSIMYRTADGELCVGNNPLPRSGMGRRGVRLVLAR